MWFKAACSEKGSGTGVAVVIQMIHPFLKLPATAATQHFDSPLSDRNQELLQLPDITHDSLTCLLWADAELIKNVAPRGEMEVA